ncbi:restriction endonuclease subunit S [Salmonella enterica subsp. enterica serovar Mbandaka]|uniref:Restriction endonuclease subunit S n=1 Tax=Salmonella enterica TaxID=28901 RepID=A0A5V3URM5_SALER|nr:restriction endonuclease subunit S [Salmonella enterica]EAV5131457.1 restriction endonuclease subunit S [Salmonella enterica subsp. enterica]EIW9041268.1 restriction endonuclease subunit S [Klebsiella pneumoniae]ELY6395066.1 restriction endonuclease subunit S [Cronobacter sakazakii]MBJ3040660.1 restriction endonuclease subunit S [Salmonella enterica subsp. enterica serovar Typhimurium]MBJ5161902.1 restriction endonuclease subunit S [Salmonella enterica subsp. enterica serovar Kisii]MBJ5340
MSIIECQLKDALELAYGKSLPERNRKEGIVPVYGSGGIGGYHSVPLVEGPGVIVGRKGTVGSVYFEKNDFFPIDTVYFVRPFLDKISLEYSYYLLKNLPLASLNSDAAVPGLNRDRAYSLPIRLPSSDQQSHIVKFLRSYDDLIENNRRRIQLLEESARLLYQEWFVHLRFPGHKQVKITGGVPEGWSKEPLENLLVLQRGFDLPVSKRIEGSVPIYASTGINGFHNVAKVKGPGVVTGRSGSLGTVMYVAKDYWPLNTTLWVKEFKKASPIFATYLLRAMKLEGYNGGAAVPTLNRNDVHKVDVLCPESKLMNEFEVQVENIFKQIDKLKEYNEKLAQARDLLLPKLMSGELTV